MHKLLLAVAFLLASMTGARAQPCSNNISLYTQADVDAFASRNLSVVDGTLYIQAGFGGNITNLNGLASITRVCGDLYLVRNTNLLSLAGLRNLTAVGGNLRLEYNSSLTNLTGLDNLQTVGLDLTLLHNDNLASVTGLGALQSIGRNLGTDNSNVRLPNLRGLNSLTKIGGSVSINGANFIDLQGLNRLKSLGGALSLDAVGSLAGLDSLASINGELSVRFTGVRDLTPLGQLSGLTALTLQGNPNLSYCHVANVCRLLQSPNGRRVLIQGNAVGCDTEPQVLARCATVTAVAPAAATPPPVYPNPAREYLANPGQQPYRVYDACGRTLLQGQAARIPVAGLVPGLYYFVQNNRVAKFIKE